MSDQSPQGFPRELLEQPIEARRHYFEKKVVAHQHLKQVYEDLLYAVRYPASTSLIWVVGPTGVGKTTLLQRLVKQLIEDAAHDPATTPGHMPAMLMEAVSPDTGNFSWKDYFTRALIAADEPMVANKVLYDVRGIHRDVRGQLVIERTVTALDLRRVLEKCFHHRQPRAFIVDEAQHLKKMMSGRRFLDQMETLKSLANMSSTVHVLVGTYDLLGLMNLNAQLARRSVEIHFPRYHLDQPEDLKEFKKLLRTFQRHLPLAKEPDLESHYAYFYERCLGCTGMLKTLLNKALGIALEQQQQTLLPKLWEPLAEPPHKLKEMLREIREGEKRLQEQESESHLHELREMLGLEGLSVQSEVPTGNASSTPADPSKRKGKRVGQRGPKRDGVGKETHRAG
jgi:energy-coupling factor transporter ATP-binding protein EcfA2